MAVFNFDDVNQIEDSIQSRTTFNFFKLQDDGWQAKVRFMYGPGESIKGYIVHNISKEERKPKYVECLKTSVNDPIDVCPLCQAGKPGIIQFYIPVYVISLTKKINGQLQQEEPINQVMLFQRGKTFKGSIESIIRQSNGTPIVNNVFNIVRNGKNNDPGTTYCVEFVSRDNVTVESLGERPQVEGTYILPTTTYEDMQKIVAESASVPQGVMPRTVSAPSYAQQPQGYAQPTYNQGYAQPQATGYQAPAQAPNIPF